MTPSKLLPLVLALAIVFAGAVAAGAQVPGGHDRGAHQRPGRPAPAQHQPAGKGILKLLPADSVTEHVIDTPQGKLAYTATAGTLAFYDQSGEQSAAVFFTAYVAKNAGAKRPLTFAFNGGPGAASAFLNLGLVGPRILQMGPHNRDPAQAALRDNPDTWLRFTDLVLIDPIGTGWSRAATPDTAKHFWNVRADAESMAKAIALYVDKNNRAGSPLYLLGESYGGFRAAKTARTLEREQGLAASGIVMLSPMLEGWLTFGDDQSALRAALQLPSLAATELENKGKFSRATLAAAEKFAMTEYLTTLAGPRPQGEAARAFYGKVAEISGLPLDVVEKARGFITGAYVNRLHAGKIVSRYDATFAVDNPFPAAQSARGPDPILDSLARAYGGAFASYARNELGFKTPMTYQLLANDVTRHWDWRGGRVQASVEDELRVLLAFTPSFRLLVAHGLSDMVTPYAETRYALDHLPPVEPAGRVALKLYRGGHMLYLNPESRKAFTKDAAAFYRGGE
jgi:carboxypeptidase C (cathepsin A)